MRIYFFMWICSIFACPLVGAALGDAFLLLPILTMMVIHSIKQYLAKQVDLEVLLTPTSKNGTKRICFDGQNQNGKASIEILQDDTIYLLLYKRVYKGSQFSKNISEGGALSYSWATQAPTNEKQILFEEYPMTFEQRNLAVKWLVQEQEISIYNAKYLSNMLQMVCFGIEQNKVKKEKLKDISWVGYFMNIIN